MNEANKKHKRSDVVKRAMPRPRLVTNPTPSDAELRFCCLGVCRPIFVMSCKYFFISLGVTL